MSRRAERLHRKCPTRKKENVDVDVTTVTVRETALVKPGRNIRTGGPTVYSL